ncbi:hypothetical protein EMIT0P4_200049 [Pseudomonas sp. IT-P4]
MMVRWHGRLKLMNVLPSIELPLQTNTNLIRTLKSKELNYARSIRTICVVRQCQFCWCRRHVSVRFFGSETLLGKCANFQPPTAGSASCGRCDN